MSGFLDIWFNCAILWIYIEAIWFILINIIYYLSIPWMLWGSLILIIIVWIVKNAPPDRLIVNQVLGVDPIVFKKDDLTNNERQYCMRVVAHRGGGYDYPENSLSAFQNSKDKGCTAVEFDLAFTKDNIPIIFHDETIERLTGKPGVVREMTWEELQQLDISATHPLREKFNGGKIATFSDTIEQCLSHDLRVFIDVKETSLEVVQVILDEYKKHPELYKKAIVTSFYPTIIYMLRRRDPKILGSFSYRPNFFSAESYTGLDGPGEPRYKNIFKHMGACLMDNLYEWALPRFVYNVVGISTILLHKDMISPQVINEWRNRGVRVIAWSVNLPSEKLHFSKTLKITYLTDTLLAEKVS